MIFAVLKFQFASNTYVLNLLVFFHFIFAVLYRKFDEKIYPLPILLQKEIQQIQRGVHPSSCIIKY